MIFDRDYFLRTAVDFRRAMTDRETMTSIRRRDAALSAFCHVFFTALGLSESDEITFHSSVDEFSRRCVLVDLNFAVTA